MDKKVYLAVCLVVISFGCALAQWKTPDTIPIRCGKGECNIWTEYCYRGQRCYGCNKDTCNLLDEEDGRPPQCYFYCEHVKEKMKAKTAAIATTPVPPEKKSEDVQIETVLLVVLPLLSFLAGLLLMYVGLRSNVRWRRKQNGGNTPCVMAPQGEHSGSTHPQETVKLVPSCQQVKEPME